MAEAAKEVRKMGYSPKTAVGKKAQKIAYQRKHGKGKQNHTKSSNNGGKKKTGVNGNRIGNKNLVTNKYIYHGRKTIIHFIQESESTEL